MSAAQGDGVTSGLKHVDKSQMTHKNPELRASSVCHTGMDSLPQTNQVVSASAPSAPAISKVEASAAAVVKPPKTELQGNKWVVVCPVGLFVVWIDAAQEFHKGNKNIVIEDTSIKQAVYAYKSELPPLSIAAHPWQVHRLHDPGQGQDQQHHPRLVRQDCRLVGSPSSYASYNARSCL